MNGPEVGDCDFVVRRGTIYQIQKDDYGEVHHLKEVEEIPDWYWDMWEEK